MDSGKEENVEKSEEVISKMVSQMTRFLDICDDIFTEYQNNGHSRYSSINDDPIYKRFKKFSSFYKIAKSDDDVEEFFEMIKGSCQEMFTYIEEDKEVEGDWLNKRIPDWEIKSIEIKKGSKPVISLSNIYKRANTTSEALEAKLISKFKGMNKGEAAKMLNAIRKQHPVLDYSYKFYLYLLYLYRTAYPDCPGMTILNKRIKDMEIMLEITDEKTNSTAGSFKGIFDMATNFAKSAGVELPDNQNMPSEDQINKILGSIMGNEGVSSIIGNVAKKVQNSSNMEEAIGKAFGAISEPETINALKSTQKDLMGDEYKEGDVLPGEKGVNDFAKNMAKMMTQLGNNQNVPSGNSSSK